MKKVLKINFSGASSTGKSTLCKYCSDIYNEPCALERMRDVMIKRKIGISQITNDVFIEALDLQQKDISAKEAEAKRYLFVDSGPLIFYLGNKYSFGRDFPLLKKKALDFYRTQDIVFLCDNHIAFDDSVMRGDCGTKDFLHEEIVNFLHEHRINYHLVSGSVVERAEQVKKHISAYEKQHLYAYGRIMNALKGNQK